MATDPPPASGQGMLIGNVEYSGSTFNLRPLAEDNRREVTADVFNQKSSHVLLQQLNSTTAG